MPDNAPTPTPTPAPAPVDQPAAKAGDDNLMAAISYISLLGVIMLLVKKDSEFVQFHAKQGTVIFIAEVILVVISSFSWFLFLLWNLVWLVFIIVSIIGFIKAYSGERYRMPVVADIADKIHI